MPLETFRTSEEERERCKEKQRAYRAKNPDQQREYRSLQSTKLRRAEQARQARVRATPRHAAQNQDPEWLRQKALCARRWRLRKLGVESPAELALRQEHGVCEICGLKPSGKPTRGTRQKILCMDHCHATGKFRGLLCANCNAALGWAKDDPTLLRKMADYLEAYEASKCR